MITPTQNSYSLIPLPSVVEQTPPLRPEDAVDLVERFNTEVIDQGAFAIGKEIIRLDQLVSPQDASIYEWDIIQVLNLDLHPAMRARILETRLLIQGSCIWTILLDLLEKSGNTTWHEVFYWLRNAEAVPLLCKADQERLEKLLGPMLQVPVSDKIDAEFDGSLAQIIMWGPLLGEARSEQIWNSVSESSAELLITCIQFFPPTFWQNKIHSVEKMLDSWVEVKNLLTVWAKYAADPEKYSTEYAEKNESASKETLHAVCNLWYHLPKMDKPIALYNMMGIPFSPLAHHRLAQIDFRSYLDWNELETFGALVISDEQFLIHIPTEMILPVFKNQDPIALFRENDIEQIKRKGLTFLATTKEKWPLLNIDKFLVYLFYLERWSLTFKELENIRKLLFSDQMMKKLEKTMRTYHSENSAHRSSFEMCVRRVEGMLGKTAADAFSQNSLSITHNFDNISPENNPKLYAKLILEGELQKDEISALKPFLQSDDFLQGLHECKLYLNAFSMYLQHLLIDTSFKTWIAKLVAGWASQEGPIDQQLDWGIETILKNCETKEILQKVVPTQRMLFVFQIGLRMKIIGKRNFGEWVDKLLNIEANRADKKFWRDAKEMMVQQGNKKLLKKLDERIRQAPEPEVKKIEQQRIQAASVPLQVAAVPVVAVNHYNDAIKYNKKFCNFKLTTNQHFVESWIHCNTELKKGPCPEEIAKLVLACGPNIWDAIASTIPDNGPVVNTNLAKSILLFGLYPEKIQIPKTIEKLLETVDKDFDVPVMSQLETVKRFGRVQPLQYSERLYDKLTPENCLLLFYRLLYTDCDDLLLEHVNQVAAHFDQMAGQGLSDIEKFLVTVIKFKRRFHQEETNAFWNAIGQEEPIVIKALLNLIQFELTLDDIPCLLEHSDPMNLRVVAAAMYRNRETWNSEKHWALVCHAILSDNLLFQLRPELIAMAFSNNIFADIKTGDLEGIKKFTASLYRILAQTRSEERAMTLATLAAVMRHLEILSLSDHEIKKYYISLCSLENIQLVGLCLSGLHYSNPFHHLIVECWFRRYTVLSKMDLLHFTCFAVSLTNHFAPMDDSNRNINTYAFLKDFGETADWYAKNRTFVIQQYNAPSFHNSILINTFTFKNYMDKPHGASLNDAAVEIYLKYFKGEKQLKKWLKSLVRNFIALPKLAISIERFRFLLKELDAGSWKLQEMLEFAAPNDRFLSLLEVASETPEALKGLNGTQLFSGMDTFMAQKDGDETHWEKALKLFTAIKSKARIANFKNEFTMKSEQFRIRIQEIKGSDAAVEKTLEEKRNATILSICGDRELCLKEAQALITAYQQRMESYEKDADCFKIVLEELDVHVKGIKEIFQSTLDVAIKDYMFACSEGSNIEKLVKITQWENETKGKIATILDFQNKILEAIQRGLESRLEDCARARQLQQKKLEMRKDTSKSTVANAYQKALDDYRKAVAKIAKVRSKAIDAAVDLDQLQQVQVEYRARKEVLKDNLNKKMAAIAAQSLPQPKAVPEAVVRDQNRIKQLEMELETARSEKKKLQEIASEQEDLIKEQKYLLYTPEVIHQKQYSAQTNLIARLETILESPNPYQVRAGAIKGMIDQEGKILTSISDIHKVLGLADYKLVHQVGSHKKFVGQFGERLSIANHINESRAVEVLVTLKAILKTTSHWIESGN